MSKSRIGRVGLYIEFVESLMDSAAFMTDENGTERCGDRCR